MNSAVVADGLRSAVMGKTYDAITPELREFIERQRMFFVGEHAAGRRRARQRLAQGAGLLPRAGRKRGSRISTSPAAATRRRPT